MPAFLRMNGLDYALGPGVTIVGRDRRHCDVVVPHDDLVSAIHAYVVALPAEQWLVLDAKSSNGTWVEGRRVDEAMLADGTRLTLGNTRALVRVAAGDGEPELVPDQDLGRLRSGTAVLLPEPRRMRDEASRSAFDRLRGLQNACLELAGASAGASRRLEQLAELTWAMLGPATVMVLVPREGASPWMLLASEPERPHRLEPPLWARERWPMPWRTPTQRARIDATLARLGGPGLHDPRPTRLLRPVVAPAREPGRAALRAVVEVERPHAGVFTAADRQVLEDLATSAGVGLASSGEEAA